MHYDAVTHAQQTIKNLRSEVKYFLHKNEQNSLPHISKRLRNLNQCDSLDIRYSVKTWGKCRTSRVDTEGEHLRSMNTISFQGEGKKGKRLYLNSSVKNANKINLPSMQKKQININKIMKMKSSVNYLESELISEIQAAKSKYKYSLNSYSHSLTDSPQLKKRKINNRSRKTTIDERYHQDEQIKSIQKSKEQKCGPWEQNDQGQNQWFEGP